MKTFKSILSMLLVLCLLVSAAPAQADAFLSDQSIVRDVSHTHIHHDHTDQVVSDVDSDPETTAYTVTFSVPDGVKAPAAMICGEGDSITLPAAEAPTGYVFVGWVAGTVSPTAILPDPILTGSYAATANITLKALYLHTETISFGYTPVDATPESWEGNYVITFGRTEDAVVLKGLSGTKKYETKTAGGAVSLSETGITLEGSLLYDVNDAYVFEITSAGDKLVIRNTGTNTYLANRGSYLYSYKTDAEVYCRWTLSMNGTTTEATNDAGTMRRYLSFSQQVTSGLCPMSHEIIQFIKPARRGRVFFVLERKFRKAEGKKSPPKKGMPPLRRRHDFLIEDIPDLFPVRNPLKLCTGFFHNRYEAVACRTVHDESLQLHCPAHLVYRHRLIPLVCHVEHIAEPFESHQMIRSSFHPCFPPFAR